MENLYYIKSLWRFWVALVIVGVCTWLFYLWAPAQHNPWKPLNLKDPIGLATYAKFTDLKYEPETCYQALSNAEVDFTPLEDTETGPGCGYRNAVNLERTLTPYSAPVRMSCPLTAALYVWERQAARPLAEELLGSELAQINTYGTYACRNIAGTRRRSQHATANAIDISGFELADGRRISVINDWGKDTPEGEFLERVHAEACHLFSVTLGPDYNAAHRDHFHLDFGSGNLCR